MITPSLPGYRPSSLLCLISLLLAFLSPVFLRAAKETWDPLEAADRATTECQTYPGAAAEVLFERLNLDTSGDEQIEKHYIRYKLYSQKGVEDTGSYEILVGHNQSIWNLSARVTKPDGTGKEYDKKSFNESILARVEGKKLKRMAIAVPDLAPGDILEMRWSQTVEVVDNRVRWWYCQRTLPVREFLFQVEASTTDFSMQIFNVADAKVHSSSRQSGRVVCRNMPPFEEEPNMPPMQDARGWFMMIYTDPYYQRFYSEKDEFWKALSSYWEEEFRLGTKPNAAIKAKAAELTSGLDSDEKKLAALYDFCRSEVTNLDFFNDAKLQALKKKLEDKDGEQAPNKTLQTGGGRSTHVNELFAALARAAGYKVSGGMAATTRYTLNVRHQNGYPFLQDNIIIVHVGNDRRYYSPGDHYVPPGILHYTNEAAPILIYDTDKVVFEVLPTAKAENSPIRRKGRFTLDPEGNLLGDVEIQYSGHAATKRKLDWHGDSPEEIESEYRAEITKRLPAAEITELKFENLSGIEIPLIARFRMSVPAYADVVGERIIFPPGTFEHGQTALFGAETRKFAIFFPYAYTVLDDIEIALPEGYALDAGSAPKNVGKPGSPIFARYQISFRPKARTLTYKREFTLGADGGTRFNASSYPALKNIFDHINSSDEHTLILKPAPAAAETVPAPPGTP